MQTASTRPGVCSKIEVFPTPPWWDNALFHQVTPQKTASFSLSFRPQSQIAEALARAHLSWAQDEVIGLNSADRVAVLGEVELDGSRGVIGFEMTDSAWQILLESQRASAAVDRKIGWEVERFV